MPRMSDPHPGAALPRLLRLLHVVLGHTASLDDVVLAVLGMPGRRPRRHIKRAAHRHLQQRIRTCLRARRAVRTSRLSRSSRHSSSAAVSTSRAGNSTGRPAATWRARTRPRAFAVTFSTEAITLQLTPGHLTLRRIRRPQQRRQEVIRASRNPLTSLSDLHPPRLSNPVHRARIHRNPAAALATTWIPHRALWERRQRSPP